MGRAVAVVLLVASGCLESGITRCPDGTICSVGLTCDPTFGCVAEAPCVGHDDGDQCRGVGVAAGRCQDQQCVPLGCGDGNVEGDEGCDDGNALTNDGCASNCTIERPTWTLISVDPPPFGRLAHAMAYDRARGVVVLFGGEGDLGVNNETWEWDGAWVQRTPATSPTARRGSAMVFDDERQRIVLFGGIEMSPNTIVADTWEWDGTNWIERTPPTHPPARWGHAVAYDAARKRVVMFGGANDTEALDDTWEWDGSTWKERVTATHPGTRVQFGMTYDLRRQRTVLFGGFSSPVMLDIATGTWELDGQDWHQVAMGLDPQPRFGRSST